MISSSIVYDLLSSSSSNWISYMDHMEHATHLCAFGEGVSRSFFAVFFFLFFLLFLCRFRAFCHPAFLCVLHSLDAAHTARSIKQNFRLSCLSGYGKHGISLCYTLKKRALTKWKRSIYRDLEWKRSSSCESCKDIVQPKCTVYERNEIKK